MKDLNARRGAMHEAFCALKDAYKRVMEQTRIMKSLQVGSPAWLEADREFNRLQGEWDKAWPQFGEAYEHFADAFG
jgi:hypothetical protein